MLQSNKSPGRTVGQSGPAAWPAKSTDFNPLGCYTWGRLEVFYLLRQQRVEDGELIRNALEHFWAQGTVLNCTQGQSFGHYLVTCGNTSSQLFILLCSSPFKIIWTITDRRRFLHILRVQPTRCNVSQFIYFCKTLFMFQTVFTSVIRSSKLHIQRQVCVRPLLLPAASLARLAAGSSIGLTRIWRCLCSFELLMMDGKPVWNM